MELLEKGREFFKTIPRQYYLPIGVGCIGVILFGYGLIVMLGSSRTAADTQFADISQQPVATGAAAMTMQIAVDVEGAVIAPGVYHIDQGSRVQDALAAAGGLSASADRVWVAQHVNLATKLTDGTKVYLPRAGEALQAGAVQTGVSAGGGVLSTAGQQVDINSASESDLDNLSGVGPVTAQKIISGRPYSTIQDLQTRKIVSASVFAKIKDLIVAQ